MGLAPSANVGDRFLLAEPGKLERTPCAYSQPIYYTVHGSAPDIAGKGIVNPIATISALAMLVRHLEEKNGSRVGSPVAAAIETAINYTLQHGPHTPDLGGKATTQQVTDQIIRAIKLPATH